MNHDIRLGVNIDHVATVRNARGTQYPCPIRAAQFAETAGADIITAHLREDRRHISDQDIINLLNTLSKPLNLEMAATDEMRQIALTYKPYAVCLVPEKRSEKTTEGGLDICNNFDFFNHYIQSLKPTNARISLFIDPDIKQIEAAAKLKVPVIELHTGDYCNYVQNIDFNGQNKSYNQLVSSADYAGKQGLEVHAGHGLTYETVTKISQLPFLAELNIGHFLIGEAIFTGLKPAIEKMKSLIRHDI